MGIGALIIAYTIFFFFFLGGGGCLLYLYVLRPRYYTRASRGCRCSLPCSCVGGGGRELKDLQGNFGLIVRMRVFGCISYSYKKKP